MGTVLLQFTTREGDNKVDRTLRSNTITQINPSQTPLVRDNLTREVNAVIHLEVSPFGGGRTKVTANDYKYLPVGGRLARFFKQWRTSHFWRIIKIGLTWEWKTSPPPINMKKFWHQPTSVDMDRAILKMARMRVIEKTRFLKYRSLLFSVPKRDSTESRTILDLSNLNKHIHISTFKMLTLKQVRLLLPQQSWTVALDFREGFYHVMVSRAFRPFLGFRYRGQNWRFRAMPFGLNLAPKCFTKIVSYTILRLAREGIWCLPYLDDLLIIAKSKEQCLLHLKKALNILRRLGWIVNLEKSRTDPKQVFDWLGVHYNLVEHTVSNTQESHNNLLSQLKDALSKELITKRRIMQLQGLANWLGHVNPLARLFLSRTKPLLKHLRSVPLDTNLKVTTRMKSLLANWLHLPRISQRLGIPEPTYTIQSDASLTGWGFKVNQQWFRGDFHKSMGRYSINVLELITIWWATLMIHDHNQVIRILTDNTAAISAVKKTTSTNNTLASLAELIWKRAIRHNWTISIVHIQGKFNIVADQLSRNTIISTEWAIPPHIFHKEILKLEPRLEVDLFATTLNHQLETYVSPCPDQRASAVDALKTDWSLWDHIYLFPPTPMISAAFQKLIQANIESAIVISREEPSRTWYHLLKSNLTQAKIITVRLQQIVGNKLQLDPRISKLRVWRYSKQHTRPSTLAVTQTPSIL